MQSDSSTGGNARSGFAGKAEEQKTVGVSDTLIGKRRTIENGLGSLASMSNNQFVTICLFCCLLPILICAAVFALGTLPKCRGPQPCCRCACSCGAQRAARRTELAGGWGLGGSRELDDGNLKDKS